jgi:hypothetical protein
LPSVVIASIAPLTSTAAMYASMAALSGCFAETPPDSRTFCAAGCV